MARSDTTLPMLMMVPPRFREMMHGCPASVDHAPEIRLEQPPLVVHRHVREPAVDRNAGVVDPRVEGAELSHRDVGDTIHFLGHGHVGDDMGGAAAAHLDFFDRHTQIAFVPRRQHYARAARSRHSRRRQADAARRAGDHDHLIAQSLRFPPAPHQCHVALPMSVSLRTVQRAGHAVALRYRIELFPLSLFMSPIISLDDIRAAATRVSQIARVTPLLDVSTHAGQHAAPEVREPPARRRVQDSRRLQHGRAAERRAASARVSSRSRPAITGRRWLWPRASLGAPAVVVMPTTAPKVKIEGVKGFGAEVIFAGTTSTERRERAEAEAIARGLTIVPPFDHPWIVAGQGTAGLEILEQRPDVATVLVPIGGGGLAAGVAAAIKLSRPDVRVDRRRTRGRRKDEVVSRRRTPGDARSHAERRRRIAAGSSRRPDVRARPAVRRQRRDGR